MVNKYTRGGILQNSAPWRSKWLTLHACDVMVQESFPHHWPFVKLIQWSPLGSPHKRLVMWSFDLLMFGLLLVWTNSQVVSASPTSPQVWFNVIHKLSDNGWMKYRKSPNTMMLKISHARDEAFSLLLFRAAEPLGTIVRRDLLAAFSDNSQVCCQDLY